MGKLLTGTYMGIRTTRQGKQILLSFDTCEMPARAGTFRRGEWQGRDHVSHKALPDIPLGTPIEAKVVANCVGLAVEEWRLAPRA